MSFVVKVKKMFGLMDSKDSNLVVEIPDDADIKQGVKCGMDAEAESVLADARQKDAYTKKYNAQADELIIANERQKALNDVDFPRIKMINELEQKMRLKNPKYDEQCQQMVLDKARHEAKQKLYVAQTAKSQAKCTASVDELRANTESEAARVRLKQQHRQTKRRHKCDTLRQDAIHQECRKDIAAENEERALQADFDRKRKRRQCDLERKLVAANDDIDRITGLAEVELELKMLELKHQLDFLAMQRQKLQQICELQKRKTKLELAMGITE